MLRRGGWSACSARRFGALTAAGASAARARARVCGLRPRSLTSVLDLYTWTGTAITRRSPPIGVVLGAALPFRRDPRGRELRLRPGLRPEPAADAAAMRAARGQWRSAGQAAVPAVAGCAGRAALLGGAARSLSAGACAPAVARRAGHGGPRGEPAARSSPTCARPERRRRLRRPRRGSRAASCTRPGRRSGWRPPARSVPAARATVIRCSTRCAAEAATLQGPGDLERTILALHACGASAHSLPGGDPIGAPARARRRRRLLRQPLEPDRVRHPRAARRRLPPASSDRSARRPALAGRPAERGRRLRLRRPRGGRAATSTTPAPRCRHWSTAGIHGAA